MFAAQNQPASQPLLHIRHRNAWTHANLRARVSAADEDAMACPCCRAFYRFGGVCPDCDVLLVRGDRVDEVEPVPVRVPTPRGLALWQMLRVGLPAGMAVFTLWVWLANGGI